MLVGIKYCGGCNSHFDRVKFADNVKKQLPEIYFCSVEQAKKVDYLVVICGCSCVCAQTGDIYSKYGEFFVSHAGQEEQLVQEIKRKALQYKADKGSLQKICVGEITGFRKTLTEASIMLFTDVTRDFNPVYVNDDFAKEINLPKRVFPPRLLTDYISAFMGTVFPGNGALLQEEKTLYVREAFVGDTLYANIKFLYFEEHENYYLGTFITECADLQQNTILTYQSKHLLPKKMFEVKDTIA